MITFRSRASEEFWELYRRIPRNAQRAADKQFDLFRKDPVHPSLYLKPVGGLWSVRINEVWCCICWASSISSRWEEIKLHRIVLSIPTPQSQSMYLRLARAVSLSL